LHRAFDVAVVVKSVQTAEHLLASATHEISNLMRAQKTVTIHNARNLASRAVFSIGAICLPAERADVGETLHSIL
jgi:hypothetical protein